MKQQTTALTLIRNVRSLHVGRHGLLPDFTAASDRLVDNREEFRRKIKTFEQWKK